MKTKLCGRILSSLVLAFAVGAAQAMPTTYDLSFDDGGGNTLTGSITTDGTIGNILAGNITAMAFVAAGIPSFSFDQDTSGFGFQCLGTSGCFSASATELSFNFASSSNDPFFNAFVPGTEIVEFSAPEDSVRWVDLGSEALESFPNTVVVVGTATPPIPTPEPATALLLGLSVASCIGLRAKARRQERSVAAA